MAIGKRAAKVANVEYDNTISNESVERTEASGKAGRKAGDFADKTYYLDAMDLESKPSEKAPERATVLVAEGDVISEAIADKLAGK